MAEAAVGLMIETGGFAPPERPARRESAELVVDVDGFEGPLDLLLTLARSQKVDLARISILALADQYLAYIETLRVLRLELAADYLVMAAWLAYLKSRLLLPEPETPSDDQPSGAALAAGLAFRLQRLEAMRDAAARLVNRDRLGRDVFARGAPEPMETVRRNHWQASLFDLLSAYASQCRRRMVPVLQVRRRRVWSLAEGRHVLERVIGTLPDWTSMEGVLTPYMTCAETGTGMRAVAFAAMLELVRENKLSLRQDEAFTPVFLRDASARTGAGDEEDRVDG